MTKFGSRAAAFVCCLGFASGCAAPSESAHAHAEAPPEVAKAVAQLAAPTTLASGSEFADASGRFAVFSTKGSIDLTGAFFQSLGTNGRRCVDCHQADQAWTITPAGVQSKFEASSGTDPLFRLVDGASSPLAVVDTLEQRRAAYSMLLSKALIRVGLPIPDSAEFELVAVDDPYGFAGSSELSLFRRPLPSANLKFLSAIMWDGRETIAGGTIDDGLLHQSNDATLGHAQASTALTTAQRRAIVDFESSLFVAQTFDNSAKELSAKKAAGGPAAVAQQSFYLGINDLFGDAVTGAPFSPVVFKLYDAWNGAPGGGTEAARAAVARGQALFNTRRIVIAGVSGINDEPAFGSPASVQGTCTTCHDTPNAGNHSVSAPLDIGIASAARRTADMPLYTLRKKGTTETKQTTDPGRALITGKWKDVSRFKGPILRALAARPPYFHNGSAAALEDVVNFYDGRFGIGLSAQDKSDLVAFLRTL